MQRETWRTSRLSAGQLFTRDRGAHTSCPGSVAQDCCCQVPGVDNVGIHSLRLPRGACALVRKEQGMGVLTAQSASPGRTGRATWASVCPEQGPVNPCCLSACRSLSQASQTLPALPNSPPEGSPNEPPAKPGRRDPVPSNQCHSFPRPPERSNALLRVQ